MGNLVLAILILFGYLFTIKIGQPDETLKLLLFTIGGVFFGQVVPVNMIGKKKNKDEGTDSNE